MLCSRWLLSTDLTSALQIVLLVAALSCCFSAFFCLDTSLPQKRNNLMLMSVLKAILFASRTRKPNTAMDSMFVFSVLISPFEEMSVVLQTFAVIGSSTTFSDDVALAGNLLSLNLAVQDTSEFFATFTTLIVLYVPSDVTMGVDCSYMTSAVNMSKLIFFG